MKHLKAILYILVLASLLLAACGGAATQPPAEEPPPAEEEAPPAEEEATAEPEEVTLVDWGYTGDIQTGVFGENMAKPFMESHPGVTIELLGGISEIKIYCSCHIINLLYTR